MEPQGTVEKHWEITFEHVAEPEVMKAKLESSPFFKKRHGPKTVRVQGASVVFSFPSQLDKKGIEKNCAQTFSKYGSWRALSVTERAAARAESSAGKTWGQKSGILEI